MLMGWLILLSMLIKGALNHYTYGDIKQYNTIIHELTQV